MTQVESKLRTIRGAINRLFDWNKLFEWYFNMADKEGSIPVLIPEFTKFLERARLSVLITSDEEDLELFAAPAVVSKLGELSKTGVIVQFITPPDISARESALVSDLKRHGVEVFQYLIESNSLPSYAVIDEKHHVLLDVPKIGSELRTARFFPQNSIASEVARGFRELRANSIKLP